MRITYALPATGYELPSADEMRELLRIVRAAHPELPDDVGKGFARAFCAIGHQFRLAEPSTKQYFNAYVDHCNDFLEQYNLAEVDGHAVFAAIIGHNDIPWRAADWAKGQVLEVALDRYSGLRCSNAWRDVLKGAPLRAPVGPKGFSLETAVARP